MPCVIFCSPTEGFSLSFLVFVLPLPSGSCISCTVARPTNPSPRPQCQLSMTWCPRPFLAHAVLTSSRRASLFNMMCGLTDLVDRSKIISIMSLLFNRPVLSELFSPRFRTPKRRLRNLTTERSTSKANWHAKFLHSPAPFPPGPIPYITELEQSRCCRRRVMENAERWPI
jgi:hypothetical protein